MNIYFEMRNTNKCGLRGDYKEREIASIDYKARVVNGRRPLTTSMEDVIPT